MKLCRQHFQAHLLEWKLWYFDQSFIEICSQGFNWKYSSTGLDDGLAPVRRLANIWTKQWWPSLQKYLCVTQLQWVNETNSCQPSDLSRILSVWWLWRVMQYNSCDSYSHCRISIVVADGLVPIWHQDICNHIDDVGYFTCTGTTLGLYHHDIVRSCGYNIILL